MSYGTRSGHGYGGKSRGSGKSHFSWHKPKKPKEDAYVEEPVCKALDINVTEDELLEIYKVLVQEMIVTKGLARD